MTILENLNRPQHIDRYIRELTVYLWSKCYEQDGVKFELYEDTYNVLSQLDNMLTGVVRAPAWKRIADEKPPSMRDVLFAGKHEGKMVIHVGYQSWREDRFVILSVGHWIPTHWQPLPAPPSEA